MIQNREVLQTMSKTEIIQIDIMRLVAGTVLNKMKCIY